MGWRAPEELEGREAGVEPGCCEENEPEVVGGSIALFDPPLGGGENGKVSCVGASSRGSSLRALTALSPTMPDAQRFLDSVDSCGSSDCGSRGPEGRSPRFSDGPLFWPERVRCGGEARVAGPLDGEEESVGGLGMSPILVCAMRVERCAIVFSSSAILDSAWAPWPMWNACLAELAVWTILCVRKSMRRSDS